MASPNTNLGIFTVDALHSIANIAAAAAAAVSPQRGERVIFFNGRHSLRTHSAYVLSERESESVRPSTGVAEDAGCLAHCVGAQTKSK